MPWSRLNSATIQSTIALSKLSPPRWLSPFVAFTSKTPSPRSSTETSKVPPPRSKTRMVWSEPSLSRPYASAAAVGSLMMRRTLRPAILPASFVASRCALLKYAGTVMTASVTGSPRYASASAFSFCRIIALISGGAYSLSPALTRTSSFGPFTTSYGTIFISSETSSYLRPMKRLIEKIVFWGFVTCCRRAGTPTSRWSSLNATTDGVVRPPSAFGMTVGSPPSRTAMHEFVVPRSMPIVFAMRGSSKRFMTPGRIKSKPFHVKVWPTTPAWVCALERWATLRIDGAARRRVGARDRESARFGHRQVQLPLHVLHARGGARVAAEAGGAELRGDRTSRTRARAHGRPGGPADGRRAARADARGRARRRGSLADDERRPPRPARGTARCGGPEADQRLARLVEPRPLHRAD